MFKYNNPKSKILFLEDFSLNMMGGGQKISLEIIKIYKNNNIKFIYVGNSKIFRKLSKHKKTFYIEIRFFKLIDRYLFFLYILYSLCRNDWDIVIANTRLSSLAVQIGTIFFNRNKQKIIVQHLSPRYNLFINTVSKYINRFSNCNHLLVSGFLMEKYIKMNLIPNSQKSKWKIIENINVNLAETDPHFSEQKVIHKKEINQSVDKKTLLVGYIGSITNVKGIFKLINILNSTSRVEQINSSFNINLLIFGDGLKKDIIKLKRLINNSSISINYYGRVNLTKSIYKNLDAVIVPSWYIEETLSFTALESIKYCKYTLLAPNGVLKEYIDNDHVLKLEPNVNSFIEVLFEISK